jgi:hypothetical protein
LTNASVTGDIFEVFAAQPVAISDVYTQAQANAAFISKSLTTTTGDIIYASGANTPARLGIGSTDQVLKVSGGVPVWATPSATTPTFVGAVVYRSGAMALTQNTYTISTFNAESLDTNGFHDNATNNSRITIPTGYAGKYLLFAGDVDIESAAQAGFGFYKNGSTADPTGQGSYSWAANTNTYSARISGSIIVNAAVGDYFELAIFTDGSSKNSNRAVFGCTYLGV